MVSVRGLVPVLAVSLVIAITPAAAQPAPARRPAPVTQRPPNVPPLVGATEVVKLTAPSGFVDDVVAADEQRLAYVVAVTGSKAELHVYTRATKQEQVVDLSSITLQPVALSLVGTRVFVVGKAEDGRQTAALVELAAKGKKPPGTIAYTLGPATHISLVTAGGKPRVAVHEESATAAGTRHTVQLMAVETGRRVAGGRPFEVDANQTNAKLGFRVNHWSEGMTRAHGIKAGEWDRKADMRGPDVEATYDLVTGKLVTKKIEDLFEQRKRFQALAAQPGPRIDFLVMAWDNASVQAWRAGTPRTLELDQPIASYAPKSLQGVVAADGSTWLALAVDPVNVAAVARKKADPEYLDIFRAGSDGKAIRKARVLAHGLRHWFGVVGDRFWLIERTNGFERGGRSLTLYQLP